MAAIFDGLSSNKSVVTFASWPVSISNGEGTFKLGESFERCLRANHTLKLIDFTEDVPALDRGEKTIHFICSIQTLWLSSQLCTFCTLCDSILQLHKVMQKHVHWHVVIQSLTKVVEQPRYPMV